ncbi:hypothetical protein [Trueperella pyogenes]|uniref:hypothetical protein n=1 Tax=Trueperella pyogenes TaxID=1661 RepID=UPI000FDC9262|nr:hypothetical protein [Trueperella pyogenes]
MAKSMRLGRMGIVIIAVTVMALLASFVVPLLRPSHEELGRGHKVVFVGMTGIPWEAVGSRTPTLAALAEQAAVANVSVRTFDLTTCSIAGWATLNTGVRTRGIATSSEPCAEYSDILTGQNAIRDGRLTLWGTLTENNATNGFHPQFGALAGAVTASGRTVAAIGGGAAVAIAEADGHLLGNTIGSPSQDGVNRVAKAYKQVADADLVVIDLGSAHRDSTPSTPLEAALVPPGPISAHTRAVAESLDAQLAELLPALKPGTTLIVSSLGDSDRRTARLQMYLQTVIGSPQSGLVSSPSTRQAGLIQNVDVHAAILQALGVDVPESAAGAPLTRIDSDAGPAALTDVNNRAMKTRAVVALFYILFVIGAAVIFTAMVTAIRGGRFGIHHAFSVLVVAAMPVSSFLINLLPWWRVGGFSAVAFTVGVLAIAVLITAIAMLLVQRATWLRLAQEKADADGTARLGALTAPEAGGLPAIALASAFIAFLTAVVIGLDAMLGSPLHANSVLGDQPQSGGRFYGISNAPFAVWAVALIFLAVVAARVLAERRALRIGVVVMLGFVAIYVNGAPHIGADFGGPPPLFVGFTILVLAILGVRMTPVRVAATFAGAAFLALAISGLDWLRPSPTHLGRFFQSVINGDAGSVILRKAQQLITQVPWPAWILAIVIVWVGLYYVNRAGLHPLRDRPDFPELRGGAIAVVSVLLVGMLINDSGLVIPLIGGVFMASLWVIAGLDGDENERYGRNVFETIGPELPGRRSG